MAVTKKGFVVYFNNYPLMSALPYEQQGMLFSALMVYADRVWRDPSTRLDKVLEGFPRMTQETRMACGFMAAAVQRDTESWMSKQEYRQQKKAELTCRQKPAAPAAPRRDSGQERYQQDMERIKRLLEQSA